MKAPRIIMVAAPRSGGGKTTVTLALLAAFQRRGLRVGAVKTGPDYIDPAFHAAITHRPPLNLDSWCMPTDLLAGIMDAAAKDVDVVVVESAMGLFDGLMAPEGARGAPSDIAALFGIPVLLVLDVSGQGQSVGPIAQGFARWSDAVQVHGVVLNRVASERHERLARSAVAMADLPVCGALLRQKGEVLPERHLGLVQAREHGNLAGWLSDLADKAERELDLDAILEAAAPLAERKVDQVSMAKACIPPPGQRIAVADDAAFSFLYGHLSLFWRQAGAELVPFSPLANQAPDASCDACWLPGGYPELYAGQVAQAEHFKKGLQDFALKHPVHGECGGYMVLGHALEDAQGQIHSMTGLLGHVTSFAHRKLHLGYREATLLADNVLGCAGTRLRGHEFHYATVTETGDDAPLADLAAGDGTSLGVCGGQRGLVSGSFFHVLARCSNQNILNSSYL
ncbi:MULTISPECIES: cobyrinate a,c-diamide synthase [Acetobacter]|uniref:Cobyrinate a,c-diamide synthase n=1 Tax=Acetobacter pasteurianus subsp. pasteurianus TaxID=481145 RepID=A0A1Y0XYJ9_ACEPA|nr:cobyrinate a,c-diamide synthase [Acetobacter pasteurianus]AKR47837.1 cobyrinic acid a,c-diamide synthase [Acetobacter pasteurianus]ARW47978.1 Hydrogenobyrinic acid a,c-diamide synthase (glutamine-hydrolyzing) [Acetobacter pasteurianus subsp. pasteurianus]